MMHLNNDQLAVADKIADNALNLSRFRLFDTVDRHAFNLSESPLEYRAVRESMLRHVLNKIDEKLDKSDFDTFFGKWPRVGD